MILALLLAQVQPALLTLPMEQRAARIAFEVNERGAPENCAVVESSGRPEVDASACAAVLGGMGYAVATGSDGLPTRSFRTIRVSPRTR